MIVKSGDGGIVRVNKNYPHIRMDGIGYNAVFIGEKKVREQEITMQRCEDCKKEYSLKDIWKYHGVWFCDECDPLERIDYRFSDAGDLG